MNNTTPTTFKKDPDIDTPAPIPPSTQAEPDETADGPHAAPDLHELTMWLCEAKRDEAAAKARRIEFEEAIAAQVTIDEGAQSATVDAGEGLKVTVKRGTNYKADVAAIREVDLGGIELPLKYIPADYAFDKVAYEKLRATRPSAAAKLADFITTKPAKTAVTVKMA